LIAIRGREPGKGKWDLPGGFVDPDESFEQAVVRELNEELNIEVSNPTYICSNPNTYPFRDVTYKTCDALFTIDLDVKPEMTAQDDVAGFFWVKWTDIDGDQFAFNSAKLAINKLIELRSQADN
jgi:ADP-ribose pyrophosphatase YjhB (NUDIX family)